MLAQGCGKIINTASMASLLVPHPQKQAAYNASKAAGGWVSVQQQGLKRPQHTLLLWYAGASMCCAHVGTQSLAFCCWQACAAGW